MEDNKKLDERLLCINQATVLQQWTVPQFLQGMKRHGIGAISIWRDKLLETGVAETVRLLDGEGFVVTSLCSGGLITTPDATEAARAIDELKRARPGRRRQGALHHVRCRRYRPARQEHRRRAPARPRSHRRAHSPCAERRRQARARAAASDDLRHALGDRPRSSSRTSGATVSAPTTSSASPSTPTPCGGTPRSRPRSRGRASASAPST